MYIFKSCVVYVQVTSPLAAYTKIWTDFSGNFVKVSKVARVTTA